MGVGEGGSVDVKEGGLVCVREGGQWATHTHTQDSHELHRCTTQRET